MTSRYFYVVVSANDLIEWDEDAQCAHPNRYLANILAAFHLQLDLLTVHDHYFDGIRVGQGDVFLYRETSSSQNLLALDLYKEPSDQLDLISMAIVSSTELAETVRDNVRAFYDGAQCKVCLEESNISGKVIEMIAESNYPKTFEHSNYRQQLRVRLAKPSSI